MDPQFIFTVEIRVTADDEAGARAQLDARLTMGTRVAYAEKSVRHVIPGSWRDSPEPGRYGDSTDLEPGERYELVHAGDLEPGDRIYLMAQRRIVLEKPWHPEEMRPELLRIPMSDGSPAITKLGPPFERDHLVPRLVEEA